MCWTYSALSAKLAYFVPTATEPLLAERSSCSFEAARARPKAEQPKAEQEAEHSPKPERSRPPARLGVFVGCRCGSRTTKPFTNRSRSPARLRSGNDALTLQVGLEPTTNRLTVDRSTTELLKLLFSWILYFAVGAARRNVAAPTARPGQG